MSFPMVSAINIPIAQHFKWHVSPDDFEDSPRGPAPVFYFNENDMSPSSFHHYDYEYPLATFTTRDQLPTLLTSVGLPKSEFASKSQSPRSAPPTLLTSFAPQPKFVPKPETCFLATGLSQLRSITQIDHTSRDLTPGMQIQNCSATTLPVQMPIGSSGTFDPGAELWQEPAPLASDAVTQKQMCNYCCVRQAICSSGVEGNPEMYCDVCGLDGDERWRDNRAEHHKNTDGSKNDFTTIVEPSTTLGKSDSQARESCSLNPKGEGRKKGRSKKPSASTDAEQQAENPVPVPISVAPTDWQDDTITVMMRNIPARYTVEELVSEMIAKNFQNKFDYLYLPMDFKTKRNKGYAFINFISTQDATRFHAEFDGVQLPRYGTQKTLKIARAETQGLEANVKTAKRVTARTQQDWFRPMIIDGNTIVSLCGYLSPFPERVLWKAP